MKQELPTKNHRASSSPAAPPTASPARVSRTRRDSPSSALAGLKARPKPSSPPEANAAQRARRSIPLSKLKPDSEAPGGPMKEREKNDGRAHDELRRMLDTRESLVRDLQSEVLELKAQVKQLQGVNMELESLNKKLGEDLCAAQEKIKRLQNLDQDASMRAVAALEEHKERKVKEAVGKESTHRIAEAPSPATHHDMVAGPTPPPRPPPPPPPRRPPAKSNAMNKAPALVEMYNTITKSNGKGSVDRGTYSGSARNNPHHNIVGELQNRSAHLLAIKADVETKGDFIKHLINEVQSAACMNMEDVVAFVDWLDQELSTLSDETAVLKHFNWPERKADALREAASEYQHLKHTVAEVSSFSDDTSIPYQATLRKIPSLLDKLEKSTNRLINLRNTRMDSYKEYTIPTDWMLDSGMVRKMKQFSVELAKVYMRRVLSELDTSRNSEREMAYDALISQSVRFAYRAHQFAGGLDSEAMCAFEKLKERVQSQGRASKVLLPSITQSH